MTADEAVAELLAKLGLGAHDVDPDAIAVVRAHVEEETMGDAPCTCDLAEQLRAAIDGRPPPATCVVHDPEAALNAAGVDEARSRAAIARSVADEMRTSPPADEPDDPLLAQLEAKLGLVPATPPKSSPAAVLPLNASAQDWARHIGIPSTPDGDAA
jgi:hypothetical protein